MPVLHLRVPPVPTSSGQRLVIRGATLAPPTPGAKPAATPSRDVVVPLTSPIRVGRDRMQCPIAIEGDRRVSRQHLQFTVAGGQASVEDLASTNGTLLNGKPIPPLKPMTLKPADEIQIGAVKFLYLA